MSFAVAQTTSQSRSHWSGHFRCDSRWNLPTKFFFG